MSANIQPIPGQISCWHHLRTDPHVPYSDTVMKYVCMTQWFCSYVTHIYQWILIDWFLSHQPANQLTVVQSLCNSANHLRPLYWAINNDDIRVRAFPFYLRYDVDASLNLQAVFVLVHRSLTLRTEKLSSHWYWVCALTQRNHPVASGKSNV